MEPGAAPLDDQTVVISDGKIKSAGLKRNCESAGGRPGTRLSAVTPSSRAWWACTTTSFFPEGGSPPMYSEHGKQLPASLSARWASPRFAPPAASTPFTDLEIKRLIDARPHDWSKDAHHRALPGRRAAHSRP